MFSSPLRATDHPLNLRNEEQPNLHRSVVHIFRRTAMFTALRGMRKLKKRIVVILFLSLILLYIFGPVIRLYLLIVKYKLRNSMYDLGLLPCSLRKSPILYMVDTQKVLTVWESNCAMKDVRIRWYEIKENSGVTELLNISNILAPIEIDDSHHVYKATMGPFRDISKYAYEIVYKTDEKSSTDIIASGFFKLFPDNSVATYPIQIVAFSDNQFGLPIFHRLVQSAFKRHSPNFILHAGDAVQHYENLQQWQTDFHDPLANFQPLLQTPIIYAHGNHDHDPAQVYAYTVDTLWYSFTLANTRWIVLDSNVDDKRQDEWLIQELSSLERRNAEFTIVVVHIPPFVEFWDPETWHGQNEKHWGEFVRTRYVPLFRAHGVDL
ncbi:10500_t:CDS:1, partial [Acaulospora morrowiae]